MLGWAATSLKSLSDHEFVMVDEPALSYPVQQRRLVRASDVDSAE